MEQGTVATAIVVVAFVACQLLALGCAISDAVNRRIPNRALAAIGFVATGAAALTSRVADVALGSVLAAVPLWLVRFPARPGGGVGIADVKFAAALGATGGLLAPLVGLVAIWLSSLSSAGYGLLGARRAVALGPWLWVGLAGATVVNVFGWWPT